LWVILHHLTGPGRMLDPFVQSLTAPLQSLVQGGYLAVSTFFLLSGFVLGRSYASVEWTRESLIRYGVGRYARVYPVYALSIAIMLPWIFEHVGKTAGSAGDAALLANYGLVLQGWTGLLPVHWNTPAWSLSCEIFFYLCFPLLTPCLRRRSTAALAGCSLVLPTLLREIGLPQDWKPVLHLADFTMGIAMAGVHRSIVGRWTGQRFYVPAGLAIVALAAWPSLTTDPALRDMLLRTANAALILGLGLGGGQGVRALSSEAAVLLGRASYSMYILHIPLLWWFKRFGFHQVSNVPPTLAAGVYLSGVVVLSAAVWKHVEEPANRAIRAWAAR
jgi:peptidoglycan/LPS O-acetylase OafA/YrhL